MNAQKRILVVSRDSLILQTRKLMLGAYFDVSAAGRVIEARMLLADQTFDLIVLCYTLSESDCRIIDNAAQERCSHAKILMVTGYGYPASKAVTYLQLAAEEGPFTLVKKSAELLGFEFRSKGRLVRALAPDMITASSSA